MQDFIQPAMRKTVLLTVVAALFSLFGQSQEKARYLRQPTPAGWAPDSLIEQRLPVDDRWWEGFEDPLLDSLIAVAVDHNYDLAAAADRIRMARANWRTAQSGFYPTLDLSAGWTKGETSRNTTAESLPESEVKSEYASAGLSTRWEIDVFGSVRNRAKSGKKSYEASKADYTAVMVSLAAEVASAYANLRTMQQEWEVARKNGASQEEILKIVEVRYNTGLASRLDLAQARSIYYNTLASIPSIRGAVRQYINSLAVLTGTYPQELEAVLSVPRPLPDYRRFVSVGIPANLLRQRPDVIAAERLVESNAAAVGASRADWFPKFFINGSVGFAAHDMDRFFDRSSLTYQIAPSMSWTLFNGLQLSQAVKLAKAQLDESIEQYNQTVLTAVQEVDNAITSYRSALEESILAKQVVGQGEETLSLSMELYRQGLSDFQNVLDAQRSLLGYENSLVAAQGNALLSLIQLYKSVGGGWDAQSSYNASNSK